MNHHNSFGSSSSDAMVRCSVARETVPKNPVDVKILRSAFEVSSAPPHSADRRSGSRTDRDYSPQHGVNGTRSGHALDDLDDGDHYDDSVDRSQPLMADVLIKFRQLERKNKRGKGGRKRSSSVDRVQGQRSSYQEAGSWKHLEGDEDSDEYSPPSQTTTLIEMFRQLEGKNSRGKRQGVDRSRSVTRRGDASPGGDARSVKSLSLTALQVHKDGEAELPEEGLVLTLLEQWKALEKPASKKKRNSWMVVTTQTSRKPDLRMTSSMKTYTGVHPKSPVVSQKAPAAFQTTYIAQKTTVAPKTVHAAPPKTTVVHQKTTTLSSSNGCFHGHESPVPAKETRSLHANKNVDEPDWRTEEHGKRTGSASEVDENGAMEGITRNMAEKFRQLQTKQPTPNRDSKTNQKQSFRWEVKEVTTLGGRPLSQIRLDNGHHPDKVPATPPGSPDLDHSVHHSIELFSSQPDLVEHSHNSLRKVESNELPLPEQTKSLLAKYEAMHRLRE